MFVSALCSSGITAVWLPLPSSIHLSPLPHSAVYFPHSWLSRVHRSVEAWQAGCLCQIKLKGRERSCDCRSEENRLDFFTFSRLHPSSSLSAALAEKLWHCFQFECLCVLGNLDNPQRNNDYLMTCSVRALIQSHSLAVTVIQRWWWWWLWRGGEGQAGFALPTRHVWFLTWAPWALHPCLTWTNLGLLFWSSNLCFHISLFRQEISMINIHLEGA